MSETITDILREMRTEAAKVDVWDGNVETSYIRYYADRIETAYNREIAAKDEEIAKLKEYIAENDINGDTAVACLTEIKNLAEEKMAEIERLRALVGELADKLASISERGLSCDKCEFNCDNGCVMYAVDALVAKAREMIGGVE